MVLAGRCGARQTSSAVVAAAAAVCDVGLASFLAQVSEGKVKPSVLAVEFGKKLFFKVKMGNMMQKIKSRWKLGIFVGI